MASSDDEREFTGNEGTPRDTVEENGLDDDADEDDLFGDGGDGGDVEDEQPA